MDKKENILILNDIRSVHNVGAIFRTADAVGISKIYLTGYTPSPIDRFGRKRSDLAKAALGAEETIEWESFENVSELITKMKVEGYLIVGLEQDEKSIDYKDVELRDKNAILLGNEVLGIPEDLRGECDVLSEIPMVGKKESLNVSVATGVFLFRIFNI